MPNEGPDQWGIRDAGWENVGSAASPNAQSIAREREAKMQELQVPKWRDFINAYCISGVGDGSFKEWMARVNQGTNLEWKKCHEEALERKKHVKSSEGNRKADQSRQQLFDKWYRNGQKAFRFNEDGDPFVD